MATKRVQIWKWRRSAALYLLISLVLGASVLELSRSMKRSLEVPRHFNELGHAATQVEQLESEANHFARDAQLFPDAGRLAAWEDLASLHRAQLWSVPELRNSGATKTEVRLFVEAIQQLDNMLEAQLRALAVETSGVLPSKVLSPRFVECQAALAASGASSETLAAVRGVMLSPQYEATRDVFGRSLADFRNSVISRTQTSVSSARDAVAYSVLVLFVLALSVPILLARELVGQRRNESRVKALLELGEGLSGTTSPLRAARLIGRTADNIAEWDACLVAMYDGAGLDVIMAIDVVDGKRTEVKNGRIETGPPFSDPISEPKLVLRRPGDVQEPTMPFGNVQKHSASLMYAPIRHGPRVIGIISLQSYRYNAYNSRDLTDLQWLADRCAAGLSRARVYEVLRRSKQRYRVLLESNRDGVYLIQGDKFRYCNQAYATIFGYSDPKEIVDHKLVSDLVAPEDRARMRELVKRRLMGLDVAASFTFCGLKADGSRISCEVQGAVISYEGKPTVLGTLRDVSERLRAEQEVLRLHQIYREATEALGAMPYLLNHNTGVYDFLGGDPRWLTGYSASEFSLGLLREKVRQRHIHDDSILAAAEAERVRVDFQLERSDKSLVWIADASTVRTDGGGRSTDTLGILMDISERKRAEERALTFASIGARLGGVTTADEAARVMAELGDQLFGWDACSVNLYDPDKDAFHFVLNQDVIDGVRQDIDSMADRGGPFARKIVFGEAQLVLRKDIAPEDVTSFNTFGDRGRRSASLMFAPMRNHGRPVGYVSFQSYKYNAYTERDLDDLQALADHCAAGLERARLYEMLNESESQFRSVWECAGSGMRITDANGVIRMVNPAFCKLVRLPEDQLVGRPLSVYYTLGIRDRVVSRYKQRFARRNCDDVRERTLMLWNGDEITLQIANSFVTVRDEPLLISIFTDRTGEKQLEIQLRQSAQDLERLARTDSLTGLLNRRAFLERLHEELARAQRYGSCVSVLMIDLDHFKNVNDTYGHLVGDEVLANVGAVIREMVRSTDIAGRYGGEELCVAMPETSLDGAQVFAERLRLCFAHQTFVTNRDIEMHVTCSIGVGHMDGTCADVTEVLNNADQALYRAKVAGRDRVSV